MKILIVMDPGIMIPVKGYGGHERLVEMFAKEYHRLGHEVHLLVTSGSHVAGCTVHDFGKEGFPPAKKDALLAMPKAWRFLWKHRNKFDMVHNFGRLAYLMPIFNHPIKKIMTYGREIDSSNIHWVGTMPTKNLFYTACSGNLLSRMDGPGDWEVVYNAIEFANYTLQPTVPPDAPLMFLGRIERVKGCHTAIAVAKATNRRLIIAGNISPLAEEKQYFEDEIQPHLDGNQIIHVGAVNDVQKNEYLGKAAALLFPIEWNEPFGIVMIEAMACGTPVIAFNAGSVNEVVRDGVSGYKVTSKTEMIDAVSNIYMIDRTSCRAYAANRFDVKVIAAQYLSLLDHSNRVVIVSTHQPAANPRAVKEYRQLKSEGRRVKYLYAYNTDWSYIIDKNKFAKGELLQQDFVEIGGNPYTGAFRFLTTRIIYRIVRECMQILGAFNSFSSDRSSYAFYRNVQDYPAGLYIAHYPATLAGTIKGAKRYNAKVIFDAEDFHRGEQEYYPGQTKNVINLEDKYLPQVDGITAASPGIAEAYQKLYPDKVVLPVLNVFTRDQLTSRPSVEHKSLEIFWISQHIGPYRGLEVLIRAMNLLPSLDINLTIMGNIRRAPYIQTLLQIAEKPANIHFRQPVDPDAITRIASGFDIGFAGEEPNCYNKQLCLSNKIFLYMLAGNCLLLSDMPGQERLLHEHEGIGFSYPAEDYKQLARLLEDLYRNRDKVKAAGIRAQAIAKAELNWEYESIKWKSFISKVAADS